MRNPRFSAASRLPWGARLLAALAVAAAAALPTSAMAQCGGTVTVHTPGYDHAYFTCHHWCVIQSRDALVPANLTLRGP